MRLSGRLRWQCYLLVGLIPAMLLWPTLMPVLALNRAAVQLTKGLGLDGHPEPSHLNRAITELSLVQEERKSAGEISRLIGLAYLAQSETSAGLQHLETGSGLGSELAAYTLATEYGKRNEWGRMVTYFDRAGCQGYGCTARVVDGLLDSNRQTDALSALKAYVQAHPAEARPYYRLSTLLASLGDKAGSIAALAEALRNDHDVGAPEYAYHAAWLRYQEQDYREAALILATLCQTAPDYFPAWYLAGQTYLALDEPQEAERVLLRAAELNPEHAWTRYYLARAYAAVGKPEEAGAELRQISQLAPDRVDLLDKVAGIYDLLDDTCQATRIRALVSQVRAAQEVDLRTALAAIASECAR